MSRPIVRGSTDQSVVIRIVDATDGTPETGVEHNTSGIDLWYRREGGSRVAITEAALAAADSAHADGGIEHIGDGYYRLDLPDAAVADGANHVTVGGTVTGMVVIGADHPLVAQVTLNASGHVTLADSSITAAKFAANAITATVIADNSITAAKIAANAITATTLADNAITAAKIASAALTSVKFADDFLTAAKIAAGAITSAKIADDAITAAKIAAAAITPAKVSGNLPANVLAVNTVNVGGSGTSGSPWGPA